MKTGGEISQVDTNDDKTSSDGDKDTESDIKEGISQEELEKQVVARLVDILQVWIF